jgi:DNA adenine methylase
MGIRLTPPLKWHGGKRYLARHIVARMPRHLHYVEPFAGGLRVLLARDPDDPRLWAGDTSDTRGVSEVVNDLHRHLTNFWRVIQGPETFDRFYRIVQAVPFSEIEFEDAGQRLNDRDPVEQAVAFFIRCRQCLSGRVESDTFTGITRNRTRGGRNAEVSKHCATSATSKA